MNESRESSLLGLVSSFLGESAVVPDSPPSVPRSAQEVPGSRRAAIEEEEEADNVALKEQENDQIPRVNVVIFSKDRPWQLQELLRSMCLDCLDDADDGGNILVSIQLLVNVTDLYETAYKEVISSVDNVLSSVPNVTLTCHREDPTTDASSFQSVLEGILNNEEEQPTHWMFLTDDCLLLVSLNVILKTAITAFHSNPHIQCFLSRLHPGITWTQTRSLPSPPPRSFLRYQPGKAELGLGGGSSPFVRDNNDGVYVYPLERGELDWAYPWDLSGGMYPHGIVRSLFEQIQSSTDKVGLSHPNRLEIAGNESIVSLLTTSTDHDFLVSIPTYPSLLSLAINRVQDVCRAPLACEEANAAMWSAQALLSFYNDKKHLDIERYKATHFNSSHVGQLYVLDDTAIDEHEKTKGRQRKRPALSCLLPVHTGPPSAAMHAIRSIVMQQLYEYRDARLNGKVSSLPIERSANLCLSPMQIVIVDDRCVDGSIEAIMETLQAIASDHSFLQMTTKDHRQNQSTTLNGASTSPYYSSTTGEGIQLVVDVVSSPRPGVAVALNHGLYYCLSEFVARMDADDVAHPGRLQAQVSSLRCQQNVNVLGTLPLIFREGDCTTLNDRQRFNSTCMSSTALPYSRASSTKDPPTIKVVTSISPTDAGFAAWAMIFSCSIAHPSVVYRRASVIETGGYNERMHCAEDYELWLRMTMENCSSLLSIPRIGLWHRKHRSRSVQRMSKQTNEALQASVDAVRILLGSDSEWTNGSRLPLVLNVLRNRDTATSLNQLNEAADLLTKIEAAFLRYHNETLTLKEEALIRKDCDERIGELVTLAVQRSLLSPADVNSSLAWKVWCERCPDLIMNRVALLCQKYHQR